MGTGSPSPSGRLKQRAAIAWFAVVIGAWLVFHYWVYIFDRPSTRDLTPEQRKAVLLSALRTDHGVRALTARGMTLLRRADIAEVVRSRCTGELECTRSRKGRRDLVASCAELSVNLFCAYEIVDARGDTAAGLVQTGRGRSWPSIPDLTPDSPPQFYEVAVTQQPTDADARRRLCDMGYCGPHALDRWRRAKAAMPVDPDADARARCRGVFAEVVGRGKVCLDPGNPESREFRDCRNGFCGPLMMALPRGRGMRGVSDDELARLKADFPQFTGLGGDAHPAREVTIGYDLAVGKLEATFAEWEACAADRRCTTTPAPHDAGWGRGHRPVINVTWVEVVREFLPWLNGKLGLSGANAYRLLSDGEWEYAARAGTTSRYAYGDRLSRTDANFRDGDASASLGQTTQVGSFKPNAFGLHDMHGNVAEWVEDCLTFLSSTTDLPLDGSARTVDTFGKPCSAGESRVFRGGSFASGAHGVRSASRGLVSPLNRSDQVGFRVARTLHRPARLDAPKVQPRPRFLE